jgi:hypothetical protein
MITLPYSHSWHCDSALRLQSCLLIASSLLIVRLSDCCLPTRDVTNVAKSSTHSRLEDTDSRGQSVSEQSTITRHFLPFAAFWRYCSSSGHEECRFPSFPSTSGSRLPRTASKQCQRRCRRPAQRSTTAPTVVVVAAATDAAINPLHSPSWTSSHQCLLSLPPNQSEAFCLLRSLSSPSGSLHPRFLSSVTALTVTTSSDPRPS